MIPRNHSGLTRKKLAGYAPVDDGQPTETATTAKETVMMVLQVIMIVIGVVLVTETVMVMAGDGDAENDRGCDIFSDSV